jgi:hypothetical protein
MARGFFSAMAQAGRQYERAQRAHASAITKLNRVHDRQTRQMEKAERLAYLGTRQGEVDYENARLSRHVLELSSILNDALKSDSRINFDQLRRSVDVNELDRDWTLIVPNKPELEQYLPAKPSFVFRWLSWVRTSYETRIEKSKALFAIDLETHEATSQRRINAFSALQKKLIFITLGFSN